MGKGTNGLIMKVWRADNYKLRVTSVESITDKYLRIGFEGDGVLAEHPAHPTQFIRIWIPDAESDKLHHRGYTLINQDPETDRFDIEFALHGGPASQWAARAEVGDTLEASSLGMDASHPDTDQSDYVIFGDTASLPAINALLDAIPEATARVWLESQYDSDPTLPVHAHANHEVTWLPRVDDGRLLREAAQEITCVPGTYAWIACDGATTRSIVKTFRTVHTLPKTAIKARAYWK
ncbi:siderophore-interacting protein [Nocardia sp. SSK8]|uniref:siderophore-interacting protein n=1 Tax=Nocardia sp. SSK8 TaxID=3120154 RepID=UPI00300BE578